MDLERALGAFPWLDSARFNWLSSIDCLPEDDAIGQAAASAIEGHPHWFIPVLCPWIGAGYPLSALPLSARPANRLSEANLLRFGDLDSSSISDLLSIRSMGAGSIDEIVRSLFELNMRFYSSEVEGPPPTRPPTDAELEVPDHALAAAPAHLETLAAWTMAAGTPHRPLTLIGPDEDDLPPSVREASRWLRSLTAVDAELAHVAIARQLSDALSGFAPRDLRVIEGRVFSDPVETLDAIGHDLGVTRERVRQIAARIAAETSKWVTGDSELAFAAAGVRHQLNPISSLDQLLQSNILLRESVEAVHLPAWYVLDKLDDGFESDGRWVGTPSLDRVRDDTHVRFGDYANEHGAASVVDVHEAFREWSSLRPDDLQAWLKELGYSFVHDFVFAATVKSVPDRAAALLSMLGEPQNFDVLHEMAFPDRNERSARQQLQADRRLVRTDRAAFGLAEWGIREYTTVKQAIGDAIDEAGGLVPLAEVVADLSTNFSVTPGTVSAFAHAWPYEVVEGDVRRAQAPRPSARSKAIAEIRNAYHDPDGVVLRVVVTSEHLRGSGWTFPASLAPHIQLEQGATRSFVSSEQVLRASWNGPQPQVGSIRAALAAYDAHEGDSVTILFARDETCQVRVARRSDCVSPRGVAGIFALDELTIQGVARRLGLADASWSDVLLTLRARREEDAANLLTKLGPSILQ